MARQRETSAAVRVYTVCDESRFLIVRNVPALGCGDELRNLFSSYGEIEDFKPMDAEECDQFTDVYWIQFHLISNSRLAKRNLDEFVFFGNKLDVNYAPHFESLSDVVEKMEERRKEVLARVNPFKPPRESNPFKHPKESKPLVLRDDRSITSASSDKDYFPVESMNQTVKLVREKLDQIQKSKEPEPKRARVDNRRRI